MNKDVIYHDLDKIDYQKAHTIQDELLQHNVAIKLQNRKQNTNTLTTNNLILCEHPHVYTLGRNGKKEHLLANEALLKEIGATYHEIGRGGDITYHGPGQLVGYPILDLENFFTDIHKYMRLLEDVIINTCADFGIDAGRIDGLTGVWLDYKAQQFPRKICAMGVKASRWITMHGFALNVNTDLRYFGHIVPCGIDDKAVTSLKQELGREIDMDLVKKSILKHFTTIFGMKILSL